MNATTKHLSSVSRESISKTGIKYIFLLSISADLKLVIASKNLKAELPEIRKTATPDFPNTVESAYIVLLSIFIKNP